MASQSELKIRSVTYVFLILACTGAQLLRFQGCLIELKRRCKNDVKIRPHLKSPKARKSSQQRPLHRVKIRTKMMPNRRIGTQTKKNKGSAIFIHVAKKNYKKTQGCVAVRKSDLLKILKVINASTKVKIVNQK